MSKFRLLSIDGGGVKGVFPAAFLAHVEGTVGQPVADFFDLIVGTSTGGIIALGLGLGYSAEQMLNFYKQHGPTIFPSRSRWSRAWRRLRQLGRSAYDETPLAAALQETFQERTLGESTKRLVIPAFSGSRGEVYIFKTRHHTRFEVDARELARDVALATSAAPTYFRAHTLPSGVHLLDGGLWANNPLMVGVVEALTYLGASTSNVVALSLGCTATPLGLRSDGDRRAGAARWAVIASEWLMRGQAINATNQARLLLGKQAVLRIQPEVRPGLLALDDAGGIATLEALGRECAREHLPQVRSLFLGEPAAPFVPVL